MQFIIRASRIMRQIQFESHVENIKLNYTLFFIRIYFIRISRLKFAKYFKNILRTNPRLRFLKGYNFVC